MINKIYNQTKKKNHISREEKKRKNNMIKDLCFVDVLQTKAKKRRQKKKKEKEMNYIYTHTHTCATNADNHTSHADNKENNNRSFTMLFFWFFSSRSIDRSIKAREYVYV